MTQLNPNLDRVYWWLVLFFRADSWMTYMFPTGSALVTPDLEQPDKGLWKVGRSWKTQREPTRTQHVNSTQKGTVLLWRNTANLCTTKIIITTCYIMHLLVYRHRTSWRGCFTLNSNKRTVQMWWKALDWIIDDEHVWSSLWVGQCFTLGPLIITKPTVRMSTTFNRNPHSSNTSFNMSSHLI